MLPAKDGRLLVCGLWTRQAPGCYIWWCEFIPWIWNMYSISMQAEASTDKKSLNLFPTPSHHPQLQSSAGERQITGTLSRSPALRGKKGSPRRHRLVMVSPLSCSPAV